MRGTLTLSTVLALVLAIPRFSLAQPKTPAAAVQQAENAFEYRDFERVVKLLYPWLHPRLIEDGPLAIEARKLLGVSLHVLGRTDEAKQEFAELLILDPRYKLDPFLVPPAVIQAFDDVRESMKATLDQILKERGDKPLTPLPDARSVVRPVEVPSMAVVWLPGGVPQFAADETGWGMLWAVLQVGFLTLNLVAFDQAGRNDGSSHDVWTTLQYTGLGGFLGAWAASGIQGYGQLKAAQKRRLEAVQPTLAPDPTRAAPPLPSGPSVSFGWEF